jgi:GNAT superfamily N-acetyltransferase
MSMPTPKSPSVVAPEGAWRFTEQAGPQFGHFTFPRFQHLLLPGRENGRENVTAIGAFEPSAPGPIREVPIGLALLWRKPPAPHVEPDAQPNREMQLLSIMVHRLHRGEGLARALMARVESAAAVQGCASLAAFYSSRLPRRRELEGLLARCGWGAPEVCGMRTAGYAAAVAAEMDGLEAGHRPFLPPGAFIEPWSSVTESERGEVDALVAGIHFNAPLAPSLYEKTAHPELSIVLRLNGRIAGWVFGERHSDDLCYYPCGYIIPALYRRASYVALIREVCRAQAALFGPQSVAQLSATPNVPGLPRFMRERFGPCALWYDEMWKSTKEIT